MIDLVVGFVHNMNKLVCVYIKLIRSLWDNSISLSYLSTLSCHCYLSGMIMRPYVDLHNQMVNTRGGVQTFTFFVDLFGGISCSMSSHGLLLVFFSITFDTVPRG